MNYTDLSTLIQDYLEVDETTFNTHIDQFVKNAEEEIYRRVQLKDLRKSATGTLTASSEYLDLPSDYLSTYHFAVDNSGYSMLEHKDVNFMREAYPSASTTGVPRFYAEFDDDSFILAPTPASNYSYELHYFYKPTSIVDTSTSWLGNNAENALLFGSLVQAYIFLKGDQDVMAMYQGKFEEAIKELTILAEGRNNKDTYRKPNLRMDI